MLSEPPGRIFWIRAYKQFEVPQNMRINLDPNSVDIPDASSFLWQFLKKNLLMTKEALKITQHCLLTNN